jgi:hypothetical protein
MSESKSKSKHNQLTQKTVKQPQLRTKLDPISTNVSDKELRGLHARLSRAFGEPKTLPDLDLDPEDIAVTYDISVHSKDGLEFKVKGSSVLNGFLLEECIPESPFRFHAFQITNIYQPLRSKANRYLQRRVPDDQAQRLIVDSHAPRVELTEGETYDNEQIEHDMSAHGAAPPDGIGAP